MYSVIDDSTLVKPGSPIRTSLDQCLFPAPQSFSQDSTSFIASYCQGIHHLRFSSWPYNLNSLKIILPLTSESQKILLRLCFLNFYHIFNEHLDTPDGTSLNEKCIIWIISQRIVVLVEPRNWWVWVDSNHRPHPYQGCALTSWATDPYKQLRPNSKTLKTNCVDTLKYL